LAEHKYKTEVALDGKDAQLKIYNNQFFCILLDLDTTHYSALEVLRYIRLTSPQVKIVLTIKDKETYHQMGLSEADLFRFGVSELLIGPYSMGQLKTSIEGNNPFGSWKTFKKNDLEYDDESEFQLSDDKFTRINIKEFYCGNTAIFDFYLRLTPNKYLKILYQGDSFSASRLKHYKDDKKVEFLYFKTKDRGLYINFINDTLSKMISKKSVPVQKKLDLTKNLVEKYVEEINVSGLQPQLLNEGKKICNNVYKMIQVNTDLYKVLRAFQEEEPNTYPHIFLTTIFAGVICKNTDWVGSSVAEKISFACMLHNIGLMKLPESIRLKNINDLNLEQKILYKEHTYHGVQMLKNYREISEGTRQIVYQHHELINGEGYPMGLTNIKIYPPAKIVALASYFAEFIQQLRCTPLIGLNKFIPNEKISGGFDPAYIRALVLGFTK